jgi:hypothetical protein
LCGFTIAVIRQSLATHLPHSACLLITNDRVAASINGPDLACNWSLHDFPTRGVHGEQNYPAMISLFFSWLYIYSQISKLKIKSGQIVFIF